jgi:hypothetical protein
MFSSDQKKLEKMINEILQERIVIKKSEENSNNANSQDNYRVIVLSDEVNKKIMQEPVIAVINNFEEEMTNVFTMYYQENLKRRKIILSWKELKLQNKRYNNNHNHNIIIIYILNHL